MNNDNKTIYYSNNIVSNYENKYISVKYESVLDLFNDKYIAGIRDNNLYETMMYKDYEKINKILEMNFKGNAFEFTKNITQSIIDKFDSFQNIIINIYNAFNNIKNYNLKYDTYLKYLIDLSDTNLSENVLEGIKQSIADILNELVDLDNVIKESLNSINDKYALIINEVSFSFNFVKDNSSLFEIDIESIKNYNEFLSAILLNLEEFRLSSKSLDDYYGDINLKNIIVESIEMLEREVRALNNFISIYIMQQINNEDNIIYYLETNSLGLLNNIEKRI